MLSEEQELAAPPGFVGSIVPAACVTPLYFEALKIRLKDGRLLNEFDREGAAQVAVINQSFARHFWPGQNPLGKRFRLRDEKGRYRQVVGVVADSVQGDIGNPIRPMAYFPLGQDYRPRLTLHASTLTDPGPLLRLILAKVQALDPGLALDKPSTAGELLAAGLWAPRLGASLFGVFGALGLVLASVGIYGLMANSVAHRKSEIGVRVTLGASMWEVQSLVLRQGMLIALIGMGCGIIAALLLAPFARSLLFSIPPYDPVSFLATATIFLLVAAAACWIPALHASQMDPASAIRQ